MSINTLKIRDHALGAFVVAFVASIATLLLSMMARVGPPFFGLLTVGMAVVTLLAIAGGTVLSVVILLKRG